MPTEDLNIPPRVALTAPTLKQQTDERLVVLVREGHEQAFAVIVDRYRRPLTAHCRRMIGADLAQDVVQQTFAAVYTRLTEPTGTMHLRAWLYRVATNIALNTLRRRDIGHEPLAASAGDVDQERPHDVAERAEQLRSLTKELRRLPERERHALILKEGEGRSFDEIASILGGTPTGAKQLTYRARRRLRDSSGSAGSCHTRSAH